MTSATTDKPPIFTGTDDVRGIASGIFVGLNALVFAVSVTALIFFAPFSDGATWGGMAMIATSIFATLVLLLRQGRPVILGAVQIAPVAFLLPFFFDLSKSVGTEISVDQAILLQFAVLGATAFLTGAVMVAAAVFDLGRLVRLVPYPVTAGFLASAGALLVASSVQLLLPTSGWSLTLASPLDDQDIANLVLATIAVAGMLAMSQISRDYGPLLAFFGLVAGFYAVAWIWGAGAQDLRALELLPPVPTGGDFRPEHLQLFSLNAGLVLQAVPSILGAAMVSVFGLMFNLNGIELASRTEIRSRSLLYQSGVTNMVTGLLGGSVSYPSAVNTVSALHMGKCTRATALAFCGVMAVGLIGANRIVPALPVFATAGLMGFIGLRIMYAWWISPAARLTRSDSFIIGLIVLSALLISLLAAIGIGTIVACIIFAVVYGRLPVFRRIDTISTRRSSVDRSPTQNAMLDANGQDVYVLTAQGFLFFGSSEQILVKVHDLLALPVPPTTIIFDLKGVHGLDSAAVSTLTKLNNIAEGADIQIVLAEAQGEALQFLVQKGFTGQASQNMYYRDSTDGAIEEAEEMLIRAHSPKNAEESALTTLLGLLSKPELAQSLLDIMEIRTLEPGERLIEYGTSDTDVFLIDSGRLAVFAKTATGADLRIRSLRPGSFVGEIASYAGLARTADVIAETRATVYCATPEILEKSVHQTPELASAWHKAVAANLADKLHRTTLLLVDST
ncbi:MAG: cyclic nucleotide-binding domain-containing protein [Pseudomonadota bacterium]